MLKILTALGAAALAASALSTPAAAAPGDDEARIVVSYAGLDLSTPRDSARLDRRLQAAARDICGEAPGLELGLSLQVKACKADALARARSDLQVAMRSGASRTVALRTN